MKINFDTKALTEFNMTSTSKNKNVSDTKHSYAPNTKVNKQSENMTYEGRTKSIEEFKNQIGSIDVNVTQNAMTVASNTMSSKDFNKMVNEGDNPLSMDVEDTVTILDRIKLYVAMGGESVEGFTDTLDSETIKKITGRLSLDDEISIAEYDVEIDKDMAKAIKEEYEKVSDITSMSEGMKLFFMGNDKDLTIDNLYLAKHSALDNTIEQGSNYFNVEAKGYLVKKAVKENDYELKEEVTKLLENIGMEASDKNVESGVWLVKNSVMVSSENITRLNEINSVSLPMTDEGFVRVVLSALNKGNEPKDAELTKDNNIYKEAVMLTNKLDEIINKDQATKARVLAETRLMMTNEANLMLLKSGVSIDTKNLEEYVEELKKIENSFEFKAIKTINEVSDTIKEIKNAPVMFISSLAPHIDEMTLPTIKELGNQAKINLIDVEAKYEQVGTTVRKDLGDSIKKAFSNVDDILKDIGYEPTEENRRAVRILGYNSMAITRESVEEIREADRKLQSVINRLTPKDTLAIIKKGSSPIEMSVKELNEYLDAKEDEAKEEIEKYSKFLFKLDKSGEITEYERKEYIEVYRFLYQLEKTDLAAIGSVLNADRELTIANLKSAMQTTKHKGMDVKIDESFGFLVSDIRNEIAPEKLSTIEFTDEMALTELYNRLLNEADDKDLEEAWAREQYLELKEAVKAPEEVINELLMNKISVTAENLEAMHGLMKQRGSAFRKVLEAKDDDIKEKLEALEESLETKEEANQAYEDMINAAKEKIMDETIIQDSYIDVKALKLINLELSTARELANSETYEVPVDIGGEMTSINIKVVHNTKEEPNVVISFETKDMGRVGARLTTNSGEIEGYITTNVTEAIKKLEKVADKLGNRVLVVSSAKPETDIKLSKIPMRDNDDLVETKELYKIAKQFLKALKGTDNEN